MLLGCSKQVEESAVTEVDQEVEQQEPSKPLPNTGDTDNPNLIGIAPLEIHTSEGSNYFIKIDNAQTNEHLVSYFIRSGETLETKIPLGSYIIKYATGQKWYGANKLFGADTTYSQADQIFQFTSDGNQISGHTIELISQVNGNLATKKIGKDNF